jgi:hypothetical protein
MAAGFVDITETDVTNEFRRVARAWIDQNDAHRDALVDLLGSQAFEERQVERQTLLRAIEEGLLRRSLFVAMRPGGSSDAVRTTRRQ